MQYVLIALAVIAGNIIHMFMVSLFGKPKDECMFFKCGDKHRCPAMKVFHKHKEENSQCQS